MNYIKKILKIIVAIALPFINNIINNSNLEFTSMIVLFSTLLAINAINIPFMGCGIDFFSDYCHFFHTTQLNCDSLAVNFKHSTLHP